MPLFRLERGKRVLVIGPFNNGPKLTPRTVGLWARALLAVTGCCSKRRFSRMLVPCALSPTAFRQKALPLKGRCFGAGGSGRHDGRVCQRGHLAQIGHLQLGYYWTAIDVLMGANGGAGQQPLCLAQGHRPAPALLAHAGFAPAVAGRTELGDRTPYRGHRITWQAMWRERRQLD